MRSSSHSAGSAWRNWELLQVNIQTFLLFTSLVINFSTFWTALLFLYRTKTIIDQIPALPASMGKDKLPDYFQNEAEQIIVSGSHSSCILSNNSYVLSSRPHYCYHVIPKCGHNNHKYGWLQDNHLDFLFDLKACIGEKVYSLEGKLILKCKNNKHCWQYLIFKSL